MPRAEPGGLVPQDPELEDRRHPARRLSAACRVAGGMVLAAFVLAAFTPAPNAALDALAPEADLRPADAIVVLGAGIDRGGTLSGSSLRRAVEGFRLMRGGLAPVLLLYGPPHGGEPEAAVRARLAAALGLPPAGIRTHSTALTTGEEAEQARAALGASVKTILLVTGEHHMPRAAALFRNAGFDVHAAPVDELGRNERRPEQRLQISRAVAQEVVGRLYYVLSGQM